MKRILILVLALALVGGIIGYKMWNKPHADMVAAKADLSAEASAIFAEFATDEAASNEKYMNKVVAVSGAVTNVSKNEDGSVSVLLDGGDPMFGIKCNLDKLSQHKRTEFQTGEKVTFKGTCSGLLSDVVFDRCVEQ